MKAVPVHRRARQPQAPQSHQQGGHLRAALPRVGQGGVDELSGRPCRILSYQGPERRAGADLQKHAVDFPQQGLHALRELHRPAQVPSPVKGIGRLFGRDPGAGEVGHPGEGRRLQLDLPQAFDEALGDGLHHRRVEGVGGAQRAAHRSLAGELRAQPAHRFGGARDHAQRGPVDRRQGELGVQPAANLFLARMDGQHGTSGQVLDQSAAGRHQLQGVVEGKDAGQACRHVFADAVADHRGGRDAPRHPEPSQSVLDHEQGRLGEKGLPEPRLGLFHLTVADEEQRAQVELQARLEQLAAAVHPTP